ncbi:MAG: hypothetical protein JWR69_2672, partial [Pedosphaera sp.]|nr:hypothetical protein [Pedosphaera sp.]
MRAVRPRVRLEKPGELMHNLRSPMKTTPNLPLPFTRHLFTRCRSALCLTALTVAIVPNFAHAQAINPVWEYLITKPSPLPVLTNALNVTGDLENGDGRSTMDTLSALKR